MTTRIWESCAAAGGVPSAMPTARKESVRRMSIALWFEAGDDACRPRLVAFAHFVDQRHGVLQQPDLRLEVLDEAFLRRLAGRLRLQRRAALADRLIDHGEVFLQRGRRARVERALLRPGDLLESRNRFGVVLFGR